MAQFAPGPLPADVQPQHLDGRLGVTAAASASPGAVPRS
jgi:hypothetical protein